MAPRTLLLCLLFLATGAAAQNDDRNAGEGTAARSDSIADDYRRNRLAFHQQRAELARQLPALEAELAAKEQELLTLRADAAELQRQAGETAEDLPALRSLTRGIETASFYYLQPFVALTAKLFPSREPGAEIRDGSTGSDMIARYLSYLLPVTLLLLLWGLRRYHGELYRRHRRNLQLFVLSSMLILPFSSFAQDGPQPLQRPVEQAEPELAEMLRTADELLSLTRVQRYIRWFAAERSAGRRLRVSDVDLSATPFAYFDSVVAGSGEYHMTLAALHVADGNTDIAIAQMAALADPGTRYATQQAEPDRYEAIFATAAAFLLDVGAPKLAEEIIRVHLQELSTRSTFELVYPRLVEQSLSATALALAKQLLDQTSDPDTLVHYARSLYDGGFVTDGQRALRKALENAETLEALRPGLELAIAKREDALLQQALRRPDQLIGDLTVVIDLAGVLLDQDREAAARALMKGLVERVRAGSEFTVNGESTTATEALTHVSAQAFDQGMLDIAELSAAAATAPLSRVERGALTMTTPAKALDPVRIPNPDRLASPLYFGLLDEQMGRTAEARQRYLQESRDLLTTLLESDGLYVPEMMNHLALLGSTLSEESEPQTLAQLDRVLLRLESETLENLRSQQSAPLDAARSQLASVNAEIAATRGEIAAMQAAIEARDRPGIAFAASAILLVLRSLSLLAVCGVCAFVVVRSALSYASERALHRGHAFGWKLLEGLGWTWVAAVFSAPLGLLAVLVSQFFLLFHERSEAALERSQPARPRPEPEPAAPANDARTATGSPAKRTDEQWGQVVQMLRETLRVRNQGGRADH